MRTMHPESIGHRPDPPRGAFRRRLTGGALALLLLDTAIDWNGAKGAAFALLGSSSLAVIGFYVAILNLGQIRLVLDPEEEGEADTKPASPSNSYPS